MITSDHEAWVDTMLQDEHGMSLKGHDPIKSGLATFSAFCLVGFVPLIVYVANWIYPELIYNAFEWTAFMTGLAFFWVGALKGKFVSHHWVLSGIETVFVGGIAASMAYAVGAVLKGLIA